MAVGALAAAGTPQYAIDRISKEIAEVVKHPEVIKTFHAAVIDPASMAPRLKALRVVGAVALAHGFLKTSAIHCVAAGVR